MKKLDNTIVQCVPLCGVSLVQWSTEFPLSRLQKEGSSGTAGIAGRLTRLIYRTANAPVSPISAMERGRRWPLLE